MPGLIGGAQAAAVGGPDARELSLTAGKRAGAVAARADAAVRRAMGIRLFMPAPAGFDPVRASARELLAYGYPGRPDPERQPELHRLWTSTFARPISAITPQFALTTRRPARTRLRYADTVGSGWSGSLYAVPAGGDPVTYVSGQWTVPAVVPPPGDHGLSACATWIGIDSAGSTSSDLSSDILQAGTTQEVTYGQSPATWAWCQWFPQDPVTVTNLAVVPGDVMYCVICVYSPTEAAVYLGNQTTGQLASFIKDAPPNVTVTGSTAEWILESPQLSAGGFTILTKFGDVYFDNCIAGTNGPDGPQTVLGGGDASLIMVGDDDGTFVDIATPLTLSDRAFKVQYVAPG